MELTRQRIANLLKRVLQSTNLGGAHRGHTGKPKRAVRGSKTLTEFWLEDSVEKMIIGSPAVTMPRWQELPHARTRMRGLILLPGEELQLPFLHLTEESSLLVELMQASPGQEHEALGVDLMVDTGSGPFRLLSLTLPPVDRPEDPQVVKLSLSRFSGRRVALSVACTAPSTQARPTTGVAICNLAAGGEDRLPLLASLTHYHWRVTNELAHFQYVYNHALYRSVVSNGTARIVWCETPTERASSGSGTTQTRDARRELESVTPLPGENVNTYAHRALETLIAKPRPDFRALLRERLASGPVRLLSLCSGAARIEAELAASTTTPFEITLVDVNRELLEQAAAAMPTHLRVRLIQMDVNDMPALEGPFDLALCVSGLHHIVRLERVFAAVVASLGAGGELWSIGEQIGRNGNRLWPQDYEVADKLFRTLPERYRLNRYTGEVDERLPNHDCSSACFEGIRSEELLPMLDRYFDREHVYLRNCFLWRFVDLAYMDNYNLDNLGDLSTLRDLVGAEHCHWSVGGRPSELYGVFSLR